MMNFKRDKARPPEILKSTQKDSYYTVNLTEDFSEILQFSCGPRIWIRYNHLCKFLAEIVYHGFASINRLQTLGEEYTGIIQVDTNYISLPNKIVQLTAIILQFGGEALYLKVLNNFEKHLRNNHHGELRLEAKELLLKIITIMKFSLPFIKGFHKTWFYLNYSKYHISKELLGINYVLIRNWLYKNQSLHGYRILGILNFLQLTLSLVLNIKKFIMKQNSMSSVIVARQSIEEEQQSLTLSTDIVDKKRICHLCLETRNDTSVTICGHLFCWHCIIDWLNESDECPICREPLRKSNVVPLMNYT